MTIGTFGYCITGWWSMIGTDPHWCGRVRLIGVIHISKKVVVVVVVLYPRHYVSSLHVSLWIAMSHAAVVQLVLRMKYIYKDYYETYV